MQRSVVLCLYLALTGMLLAGAFRAQRRVLAFGLQRAALSATTVKSISSEELSRILGGGKDTRDLYQIVDVREPYELEDVRLKDPAVINLPLGDAGNWSVKPLEDVGLDASKPTICVCKVGMRSMKVASFLVGKGFDEVYNLEGGMIRVCDVVPQITSLS